MSEIKTGITGREAYKLLMDRKPVRIVSTQDAQMFNPSIIPDSTARGFILETGCPYPGGHGGVDMFGIDWEYVDNIGGSMVRPGLPLLADAREWKEKVIWPDIDSWKWEESAEKNRDFLNDKKYNIMVFMTGWYERLVSMMDFAGAAVALIDEEQTEAVKEFFDKLTDMYIHIFDKAIESYPLIDAFWIHDDWGGQTETFFSPDICSEMIVPYMKRVTDFLHSRGKYCDLHSCGFLKRQVPNMIDAGWDSWMPQEINDIKELHDLYGDQLILGVTYAWPSPDSSKEEQKSAVEAFIGEFCIPDKPCTLNDRGQPGITDFVRQELVKASMDAFARNQN